ncbi:TorF family putative porin [Thalassotalea agarivorans]|uniref:Outer membrane protein beta-barrel domain-containing protein n=1 Tax=Thalassotalea agarivorans TaxID=349064 RepID=A0A1I0CFJ9_THASX|nr:TorF family putative porin [Thalassotalea agarivorans]SET17887.1 conserved hypothetical protein [Thalassotalea agarivorans]
MKKSLLTIALSSALAATTFQASAEETSGTGVEGLSTNVGLVSQYYYRGIQQTGSASASAGIDYDIGAGFAVGAWTADVGDGIEVDLYGSWGMETESGFGFSVGATTYQYTGDFDSAYNEINLGASFSFVSVDFAAGKHEEDLGLGIVESDYTFVSITAEYEGFYGTFGLHGGDFEGDYVELGWGTDIGGFDAGVALILNSEELAGGGDADQALVFSLGKSF